MDCTCKSIKQNIYNIFFIRKYYIYMNNNNRKRSSDSLKEDAEIQQIYDNNLIRNINSIILKAENLKKKFINIKQPIQGEFSNALDELDLGESLENQLRINAENSRELLSNDEWVQKEQDKLNSLEEAKAIIRTMDGDSEFGELRHQSSIINDNSLIRARVAVEDYDQIKRENEMNEKDVDEREDAIYAINEYINRLENIKISLISTLNNTPSPPILPLTQPLLTRVKSASALANKDNYDQGTQFEPIRLQEVKDFEMDLNRKVITPILQRSQSAPQ